MRIDKVEVLVASPGRNFVTVRITTADGVTGLGDGTLNGRELSVASYLRDHVAPLLVGRDAHRIEDTWQYLYRGAYWRRGPVTMAAIAAVDMALWDIKAKVAGLPLYQLLGGASRTGCLTYGHANGRDLPELFDAVRAMQERGYRALRLQSGVPGMDTVYGVYAADPAASGGVQPPVEVWDTDAYLRHVPTMFEAARAEFGPELPMLHDAHHRLNPTEAARLAKDLEPYRLFWLEDVTPAENPELLRQVRAASSTPLAIGEVFNTVWDTKTLIEERLIDYVRMSATHGGGITPLRKILDFAAMYQVRSAPHGPEDISPVAMSAQIHLGMALHNFGIQEYSGYQAATMELFAPEFTFSDGLLIPGEVPGLGVGYDDALAHAHPYSQSYLPVNRLRDGAVHDW